MLKIAVLTPGFLPVPAVNGGAIETLITKLINQNEKNPKVIFDIFTRENAKLNSFSYNYTNIIQLHKNFFQKSIDFVLNKFKISHDFRYSQILKYANKKEKYDFIIVENNIFLYKYFYDNYKQIKKTKILYHLHNNIGNIDKPANLCKFVAETAYKVIVVSNFLRQRWNDITQNDNVYVLYNSIDVNLFLSEPKTIIKKKDLCISSNDFVFVYCGRLDEEKGPIYLIKAFNKLSQSYDNIKLLVIGKAFFDFKYEDYIKKIANKNVIFVGNIDNDVVNSYLSLSDVVVIPTIAEEAFGITAVEAMSCGKPIIASRRGGLPEIIGKDCGQLVDATDLENNLIKSMKKFIENKDMTKTMGKNARKYMVQQEKKFDDKEYLNRFLKSFIG